MKNNQEKKVQNQQLPKRYRILYFVSIYCISNLDFVFLPRYSILYLDYLFCFQVLCFVSRFCTLYLVSVFCIQSLYFVSRFCNLYSENVFRTQIMYLKMYLDTDISTRLKIKKKGQVGPQVSLKCEWKITMGEKRKSFVHVLNIIRQVIWENMDVWCITSPYLLH